MLQIANIFYSPYLFKHVVTIYNMCQGCKNLAIFTTVSKVNLIPINKMSDSKPPPLGSFKLNPPKQVPQNTPINISEANVILKDTTDQAACKDIDTSSVISDARYNKNSDILKTLDDSSILSNSNQVLKGAIHGSIYQEQENTVRLKTINSKDRTMIKSDKLETSGDLDTSLNDNYFMITGKKTNGELTEESGSDNVMMKIKLTGLPKMKKPVLPVQLSQLVSETVRQQYSNETNVNTSIQNCEKYVEGDVTKPLSGVNKMKINVTGSLAELRENNFENVSDLSEIKEDVITNNLYVDKECSNESLISLDKSEDNDSGFIDSNNEHELIPLKQVWNIVSDSSNSLVDEDKRVPPLQVVSGKNELKSEMEDAGEVLAIDVDGILERTVMNTKKEDVDSETKGYICITSNSNSKDVCFSRTCSTETFSQTCDIKSMESVVLESNKDIKVETESLVAVKSDTVQKHIHTPKNDITVTMNENVDSIVKVETELSASDKCNFELEQEKTLINSSCNDDLGTVTNNAVDSESETYVDTKTETMDDWLSSPLDNVELSLETQSTNVNDKETDQSDKKKKNTKKKESKNEEGFKRPKKEMPNYFISLQITNPEIHSAIDDVKNTILSKNRDLHVAMVPTPTIHLTLMVMYLADNKVIDRAVTALDKCAEKLSPLFDNKLLVLDISGIGNFKNEIVFAKVSPGEALDDLTYIADTVKICFEEHDIPSTDGKPFNPHITMMKLSKGSHKLRKKGIKKFPCDLYAEHVDRFFGKQLFTGLHLCSMLKRKGPTGYYHIEHQVKIGPQKSNFSTLTSVQGHSLEEVSSFIVHACVQSAAEQVLSDRTTAVKQKLDTVPKSSKKQSDKNVKKAKSKKCSDKNAQKTESKKFCDKNVQKTQREKTVKTLPKLKSEKHYVKHMQKSESEKGSIKNMQKNESERHV